jgi:hypothetical protein
MKPEVYPSWSRKTIADLLPHPPAARVDGIVHDLERIESWFAPRGDRAWVPAAPPERGCTAVARVSFTI